MKMEEIDRMTSQALEDLAASHLAGQNVDRYTDEVLELIRNDPHKPSPRPCETCRQVTARTGRPFWCLALAIAEAIERGER